MERTSPVDVTDSLQSIARPAADPNTQLVQEFYAASEAAQLGWSMDEFAAMLVVAAARRPEGVDSENYLRSLHLRELALAQACARGYEPAWKHFIDSYRHPLRQAAVAISKSLSMGEELADSLYAELFGLKDQNGARRSPLASYSGRGSLMGWLRTTLAQRYVDRFRRTQREAPLENNDFAAVNETRSGPEETTRVRLESAVQLVLRALEPEDRFLLASYFLDGRTLLEIARLLRVHEATVSRKLKRLTESVRKQLLRDLQRHGLSRAAAEEALGTDPRDLEIDLRNILQKAADPAFSDEIKHQQQNE